MSIMLSLVRMAEYSKLADGMLKDKVIVPDLMVAALSITFSVFRLIGNISEIWKLGSVSTWITPVVS